MRIRVTSFTKHGDHNPFNLRVHGTGAANGHVDKGSAAEHNRWGGGPCKCVAEWVHFQLACVDPEVTQHTHDLEIMDGYKRSEALAVLAKNKVEEGNGYSATTAWMKKTFGETSKQLSKFDKGDAANASQLWRNENKDLVLREEVPEDSEEMTTMRKCVDAILEADAPALRSALREVLKDSHDLTKSALSVLGRHKKTPPAGTQPEEPWYLAEGVTILDLPPPGPTERLKDLTGVYGPSRTPYSPMQQAWQSSQPGQGQPAPAALAPNILGPDGRPILSVMSPGSVAPLQGDMRNGQSSSYTHPQQRREQELTPVNMPQARGIPLQPRPSALAHGTPQNVRIHYVQAPPLPTPPPQRGSVHPIMVSMEVPSCSVATCKQCKHMHRDLAGRTFVFQDRLHTPAQFSKMQNLLRDPQQLLHDDYNRLPHKSQVQCAPPHLHHHPYPYPHPHPEPQTAQPQRHAIQDAPPLQRAPGSAPTISPVQHLLPRVRPPPPPQATAGSPSKSAESEKDVGQSADGENDVAPAPSPANQSIYSQPLPVPIVIDEEDEDAAATSDVDGDNNAEKVDNDGQNDGGSEIDESSTQTHDDNRDDATAVDDGRYEDDDGQRPAKRRRQESVAEN